MKYREGMIVRSKGGSSEGFNDATVLGVCGQVVFIQWLSTSLGVINNILSWSVRSMDDNFTILSEPKEEWVPSPGEWYFYPCDRGVVESDLWYNTGFHIARKNYTGIFKTREEAQAQLEKIKKLLAEGK